MKSSITKSKAGYYTVTAHGAARTLTATGFAQIYDARLALGDLKVKLAEEERARFRSRFGTRINEMYIKEDRA